MKKGLLASYVAGIVDTVHGESYSRILRYFLPEFVTAMLMLLPFWFDAGFISHLKSTPTYATLGVTSNLFHLIIKVAEALCVGTVVLSGQFNGIGDYKQVGQTVRDAFWVTCILGLVIASLLYFGAYWIYWWYGVSEEMIALGVPFLRLRAVGVFFTFVYFAFIGFLRGIKNTKVPMLFFILGSLSFVILDYALIFGKWGLPALGLQGSAIASITQYCVMLVAAICYVLFNKENKKYGISLFSGFSERLYMKKLLMLSWPVVLDKAIFAMSYVWLCKVLCPLGTCAVATFCVVKDMERFAFLPAIAGAQVITFLVSNDYGLQNWEGIKNNIKKVLLIASICVGSILLLFVIFAKYIIQIFDKTGDFTAVATQVFPILSVLVFFDVLQIVLSGALRGAGNVRTVMFVRLLVCIFYFVPLSYTLSRLPLQDQALKFILVYGSFYVGSAIMSLIYISRFRGEEWKLPSSIKGEL